MSYFRIDPEDGEHGLYGFVLHADNGEPVGNSTERYRDETDAKRGARDLIQAAIGAIEGEPKTAPLAKLSGDLAAGELEVRFVVDRESQR